MRPLHYIQASLEKTNEETQLKIRAHVRENLRVKQRVTRHFNKSEQQSQTFGIPVVLPLHGHVLELERE